MAWEDQLEGLGLPSLLKTRYKGASRAVFKSLQACPVEEGSDSFFMSPGDKTGSNG